MSQDPGDVGSEETTPIRDPGYEELPDGDLGGIDFSWSELLAALRDSGGRDRDRNKQDDNDKDKPKKNRDRDEPVGDGGSASAILTSFLSQFGLGGLGDWAWQRWKNGDSMEEIMLKIRDRDEYKERFPGMAGMAAKGRAISEIQYVQYEQSVATLARRYGIPDGLYNSPQAVAALMTKDYSPVEIEANMRRAAAIVYGAPQVREAFARFYGVEGDGAAIAYFLDPDAIQPELEKRYQATIVGGTALAQGLDISRRTSERVADLIAPSEQQAAAAATRAASDRALYAELIGEREDVTDDQGVLAAFGADSDAARSVERRRAERQAAYAGGGGVAASQRGVSGLSSAEQ